MTKKSRNVSQREEMTPFEERATVTISSSLKDIEQGREIFFLLKKEGLTIDAFSIDAFSISDNSYRLHFVAGTTNKITTPEGYCRSMIDGIISALKSGKIKSKTEYDFKKFDERYLKDLKGLLSQKATTTSLQEESTTEEVDYETQSTGVTDSTTTELFNSSQSEEPITEGVGHEMQEDSEYFAVESDYLEEQEFDFASGKATTKEIKDVINEITRSNASNGITTENIRNVFHFGNKSKEVLERPIFNSTDVEGPKLPEINGGLKTLAIGIAGVALGGMLTVACVGLGYLWYRKNREGSYVKKAQKSNGETGNLSESSDQTQLEHSRTTPKIEERESLSSRVSNATSVAHLSSQISTER